MGEWDKIVKERKEEYMYSENAKIINGLLAGTRRPPDQDIIRKLTERYSKYGKEQKHE